MYLGIQNAREWELFCRDVLRQPELATDPKFSSNASRLKHRSALDTEIERVFGGLMTPEILERLRDARIASAQLRSVQQFADHPQLEARGRWQNVETPSGSIQALMPPATIEGAESVMDPVPALGAHTDAVLSELGYDASTIAAWRDAGAV